MPTPKPRSFMRANAPTATARCGASYSRAEAPVVFLVSATGAIAQFVTVSLRDLGRDWYRRPAKKVWEESAHIS